jgi:hypothetical protein
MFNYNGFITFPKIGVSNLVNVSAICYCITIQRKVKLMRNKEQIKADNLAILPSLLEMGATYSGGMDKWIEWSATDAKGLSYLSFPTVKTVRPATAEEVSWGCGYYEDCPCCECGDDVATVAEYKSYRWSHSAQSVVETQDIEWLCSAHAE